MTELDSYWMPERSKSPWEILRERHGPLDIGLLVGLDPAVPDLALLETPLVFDDRGAIEHRGLTARELSTRDSALTVRPGKREDGEDEGGHCQKSLSLDGTRLDAYRPENSRVPWSSARPSG